MNGNIYVKNFNQIQPDNKLKVFTVDIANNTTDPNCPYPSESLMWWNVIQLGITTRQTQIAIQALFNRPGFNELWIREKHDDNWNNWAKL